MSGTRNLPTWGTFSRTPTALCLLILLEGTTKASYRARLGRESLFGLAGQSRGSSLPVQWQIWMPMLHIATSVAAAGSFRRGFFPRELFISRLACYISKLLKASKQKTVLHGGLLALQTENGLESLATANRDTLVLLQFRILSAFSKECLKPPPLPLLNGTL